MKRILAALFLLVFLLPIGIDAEAAPPPDTAAEHLIIHYIDVDHADAMLLIAGETTVLIDGGNLGTAGRLQEYVKQFGVEELDLVVNTHPHLDHLGGISGLMDQIPTKEIWCSHETYDSIPFTYFQSAAERQNLEITHPEPGTTYISDGLILQVLGPLHDASTYHDLNDTSLVLMAQFGERRFLFTGDMESYAEHQLVLSGAFLKADVLKVGHHGSYSSTSSEFLSAVDPDYGIISCGRDNEYGHPHDAPMSRLKRAEVELYRTDLMGDITLVTDGETIAFLLTTRDTEIDGYAKAA